MAMKVKTNRVSPLQYQFSKGGCVPIALAHALSDGSMDDAREWILTVRDQLIATGGLRRGGWYGGIMKAIEAVGLKATKRRATFRFGEEFEHGFYQDIRVQCLRQTVAQAIRDLPAGVSAIFRSSKSRRRGGHAIYFDGKRRILWNGHMRERIDWVYELVGEDVA